jgi:hypothetical protein
MDAASATGWGEETSLPNPLTEFLAKSTWRSLLGDGRERRLDVVSGLEAARVAIDGLSRKHPGKDVIAAGAGQDEPLKWGEDALRTPSGEPNREMILKDAAIPAFLRGRKDLAAELAGVAADKYTWEEWLATANNEQLTNFAQWYTVQLRTLANPETRNELVDQLKGDYALRVAGGMRNGWISPSLMNTLTDRLDAASVRFVSPFGRFVDDVAGLVQNMPSRQIVVLPTIAGESMTTHELGHVFARIDGKQMYEYYVRKLGKPLADQEILIIRELYEMLNEGFNDHMTAALLQGSPAMVSPTERRAHGLDLLPGSSDLYKHYREAFAALMSGEEGNTTEADIRNLVDVMTQPDFEGFAALLEGKWPHQDILTRLFQIACEQHGRDEMRGDPTEEASVPDAVVATLRPEPARLLAHSEG